MFQMGVISSILQPYLIFLSDIMGIIYNKIAKKQWSNASQVSVQLVRLYFWLHCGVSQLDLNSAMSRITALLSISLIKF